MAGPVGLLGGGSGYELVTGQYVVVVRVSVVLLPIGQLVTVGGQAVTVYSVVV